MTVGDGLIPVVVGDDNDRGNCPVCGMAVRHERHTYYKTEEYAAIIGGEQIAQVLMPVDPETSAKLKEIRKGKKTVAIVGMAPTSCSLAPFEDPEVEIWGLNEAHAFKQWFLRWDRWFQMHESKSWQRYIAKRDVRGHYAWLKKFHFGEFESKEQPQEHGWQDSADFLEEREDGVYVMVHEGRWEKIKPIYMQYWNSEIPGSIGYPLIEVSKLAFKNFRRGDSKIKYFTSTLAYMMGIALLEEFERIEIYGFELADDLEYVRQKACAEFWIGVALGRGVEVYTPPKNQILYSTLYGGAEQGAGW